jgi:signal transduction histidine kinase
VPVTASAKPERILTASPPDRIRSAYVPRLPRLGRSTTARIALIVFVALVISSAIILGFIARVTRGQLDADARELIVAEREVIVQAFVREGPKAAAAVIEGELRVPGSLVMLLIGPDGRPVAGNLSGWPADLGRDGSFARLPLKRNDGAAREPFAVTSTHLPGGWHLLVGRSLAEEERLVATLTTTLIAAIGLALALALGISALLARLIARRVQSIADVAARVAAGDLGSRVDVPPGAPRDAFDSLGLALNAMLARIETLLDELRAVTDGLAHDLRSPLTRMKARIERLTRAPEPDLAELGAIGNEADTLLAMLDNSLEISRLEAGIGRDAFQLMDLAVLAHDMAEMYEPLAEEGGVMLHVSAGVPVPVEAHRQLLGRALSNLIDNALRYADTGGQINISAEATPDGARLVVADRGPGIPLPARSEALRRFGRLDAARSRGGAGLGLSLAAAIARLHGGTLLLSDNNPGLKVIIELPIASPAGGTGTSAA